MYILPVIDKTKLFAIGIKKKKKFEFVSEETLSEIEMLKWLKTKIQNENEFIVYKLTDIENLFAVGIKYKIDLTLIGKNPIYLFDSLYRVASLYRIFHEPPSPYMLSKFIGYKRAEKLVKQYSALFDAKGEILKNELKELLDAFGYIYTELKNYILLGMKLLEKYK